jgi:hypothetical protein
MLSPFFLWRYEWLLQGALKNLTKPRVSTNAQSKGMFLRLKKNERSFLLVMHVFDPTHFPYGSHIFLAGA